MNYIESKRKRAVCKIILFTLIGFSAIIISSLCLYLCSYTDNRILRMIGTGLPVSVFLAVICFSYAHTVCKRFEYEMKTLFADEILQNIIGCKGKLRFYGNLFDKKSVDKEHEEIKKKIRNIFRRLNDTGFISNTSSTTDDIYAGKFCSRNIIICEVVLNTEEFKHSYRKGRLIKHTQIQFEGILILFDVKNNTFKESAMIKKQQSTLPHNMQIQTCDPLLKEKLSESGLIEFLSGLKYNAEIYIDSDTGILALESSNDMFKFANPFKKITDGQESSKYVNDCTEMLNITENVTELCDSIFN